MALLLPEPESDGGALARPGPGRHRRRARGAGSSRPPGRLGRVHCRPPRDLLRHRHRGQRESGGARDRTEAHTNAQCRSPAGACVAFAGRSAEPPPCPPPRAEEGKRMTFLSRMWAITRGHRGLLSIAVLGSVLYTALSVLPALIIRQILTVLGQPAPTGAVVLLGLAMVAATALMAIARYLEGGFGHIAAFKVLHDMRMRIYEQLQRLSMGYHTRQQSGIVAAKVIGDVETIEFFTAHAGIQLISAATVPFLIGTLMLVVNWKLRLVARTPLSVILLILSD